jgi:hypothetical protein
MGLEYTFHIASRCERQSTDFIIRNFIYILHKLGLRYNKWCRGMYYDSSLPKDNNKRFIYEDITDGDVGGKRLEKAISTYTKNGCVEYFRMAYGEGARYIWSGDFELTFHEIEGEKWFAAGFYSYHGFFFSEDWRNVQLFLNKFAVPFCNALNAEVGEGGESEEPLFTISTNSQSNDLITGKVSSISNINIFGPKILSRYGKNKIMRLPAYRQIELQNGGLLVMIGNELVMHETAMIRGIKRDMSEVLEEYSEFFGLPKPKKVRT